MTENGNGDYISFVSNVLKNIKYDLKQDIICELNPTLAYMTLLKIAIPLWHDKLKRLKRITYGHIKIEIRHDCRNELIDSVSLLKLPILLERYLKDIIYSLGDELADFFDYQVAFENINEIKICLDNIVWTQQGTINSLKSITNIIDNSNLNNVVKFELACNNCLEEKILSFKQLCSEDNINSKVFDKRNENFHFVVYWILRINGSLDKYLNTIRKYFTPLYEYLLEWAITHRKYAAVQYIWENFADEAWNQQLMRFIDMTKDNEEFSYSIKIAFYFYQKLNEIQINEVDFASLSFFLLKAKNISKWCNIFSVSKYVQELFKKKNLMYCFDLLWCCCDMGIFSMEQFQTIWDIFASHFKNEIENDFIKICESNFQRYFSEGKLIMFLGKLLLKLGNTENVKRVIYKDDAIEWFLPIEFTPYSVDTFFDQILDSKEILKFNIKVLKYVSNNLSKWYHVSWDDCDEIDLILKTFCANENLSDFKKKMPFNDNSFIIRNILESSTSLFRFDPLSKMEKFLSWCFDGSVEEINKCKVTLFDTEKYNNIKKKFFNKIKNFMQQNNWESVERYSCFIFDATEKKITNRNENLERCKELIFFIYKDQSIKSYMKFVLYSGLTTNILKINILQIELKTVINIQISNARKDFLCAIKQPLDIDKSLHKTEANSWCCSFEGEMLVSKTPFMPSVDLASLFKVVKNDNQQSFKYLFVMFNSSDVSRKLVSLLLPMKESLSDIKKY